MISTKSRFAIYGFIAALIFILISNYSIAAEKEQVISITAKKFEFSPGRINLKKGVPVILAFTSLDRTHGFNCPGLKLRTDIYPNKVSKLRIVPDKTGTFPFHCDVFCGSGHEEMNGTIIVTE